MTVKDAKVFRYHLPLKTSLNINAHCLSHREGLILQLIDAEGNSGFGEICPLPGLSAEPLDDAATQIFQIIKKLLHEELPSHAERLSGKLTHWLEEFKPCPSVRFGFEMAVLTLSANQQGKTLAQLLSNNQEHPVPLNALLHGPDEQILADARALLDRGFHSFKLKVGSSDVGNDINRARGINDVIRNKGMLRLDANQKWTFDQAVEFAEALGPMVEYIEEPFSETDRIPEFFHRTMIPIALDESVKKMKLDQIKSIEGVEVLILKPMMIGGFEATHEWIQQAGNLGLRTVLSSSFESGLGLTALASLAASHSHGVAAGLDTLKWFSSDLLVNPLTNDHGMMDLTDSPFTPSHINFTALQEVPCKA